MESSNSFVRYNFIPCPTNLAYILVEHPRECEKGLKNEMKLGIAI